MWHKTDEQTLSASLLLHHHHDAQPGHDAANFVAFSLAGHWSTGVFTCAAWNGDS